MKKSLLFSILVFAASLVPRAYAQDGSSNTATTSAAPANGAENTDSSGTGQKGKFRAAFAQLDLTDSQKQQIKQIRANSQPGKERRQQIMAVLTPDQKQKLITLLQQYRSQQGAQ